VLELLKRLPALIEPGEVEEKHLALRVVVESPMPPKAWNILPGRNSDFAASNGPD
jgi:hypothetical protein